MKRTNEATLLEHFNIPRQMLIESLSADVPEELLKSMVFTENGTEYVRWVLHPDDQATVKDIERWLQRNNVSTERHRYFTAYKTASRSYFVIDPESGEEFSLKTSTDHIGDQYVSKKTQSWTDALFVRQIADYVQDLLQRSGGFKKVIVLDEPIAFGIPSLYLNGSSNRGMLIRSYKALKKGNHYLPLFSIFDTQLGAEIARRNGSNNPAEFWDLHVNQALGRASAEFFAKTGLVAENPHSQNYLVEFDEYWRPTGRIVFKDLGDFYVIKEFFKRVGDKFEILKTRMKDQIKSGLKVQMGVVIMGGLSFPDWLNSRDKDKTNPTNYSGWGRSFFTAFGKELQEILGVSLTSTRKDPISRNRAFVTGYQLDDEAGEKLLSQAARLHLSGAALICRKAHSGRH